ncbi:MAG: hypothetical protein ACFB2X_21965, partial [Rivularia sp. (in: cyanobacteria)]
MTQSVARKTSTPEKTWRRQTDSPLGWIVFTLSSFILHLVAFWLTSLYENSSQLGREQSAVAIEFIEISPQKSYKVQPKPKPKAVSPKPSNTRANQTAKPIVPQNSQPTTNLGAAKPPISTNNSNAIAFDSQKIEQQLQRELAQQQQRELAELQRQLEAQQRQREAEFQRQLEAQQRQLAQQQRLKVEEQRQLEAQLRQREAEQQRQLVEQLRQREAQQRQREQAQRQREQEQQQIEQAQRQKKHEPRQKTQAQP